MGDWRPDDERPASPPSLEHVLQHQAVQRPVSDQTLGLAVRILQLLHPPDLLPTHAGDLFLSTLERRLGYAHISGDSVHRRTILCVPQGKSDLLVREVFAKRGIHPPLGFRMPEKVALNSDQFAG